jgi:hypothetical protein
MLWLASHWLWLAGASFVALCFAIPGTAAFLFGTKFGRVLFLTVALLAVGYWQRTDGYADGYRAADTKAQIAQKEWERAAALQVYSAALGESEANRKAEQARVDAIALGEKAYTRGRADEKAAADAVVADVAAGRYVLRRSLQCPAVRAANQSGTAAPGAAAALGDGAAAGAGGVSAGDVQFLVRFAEKADGVSARARSCQGIAVGDRK